MGYQLGFYRALKKKGNKEPGFAAERVYDPRKSAKKWGKNSTAYMVVCVW